MNLSPQEQAFFDRLDETPQQRAGGFIVAMGDVEFRSRPLLEVATARLAIYRRQLEREAQLLEMEEALSEPE